MKYYQAIISAIILPSMIILQPLAANALSAPEVGKIAEGITVLIEYKDSPNNGSGVIIKKEGNVYTILTAAHVVANPNRKYEIVTPGKKRYSLNHSTVKVLPNQIDLAVVTFTSNNNYKVASIGNSDSSERGTVAYISGFPDKNAVINESILVVTEGKIAANSNLKNGYGLVYDITTKVGMSGGAVLNDAGKLIGIHGRGDNSYDEKTDTIQKSGLNLGIPINTFVRLSAQAGVNIGVTASPVVATSEVKAGDLLARGVNKNLGGDYTGAIADFTQAINLNPQYTEAFLGRGNARIKLKDYQGAINDSNQAIKINPLNAIAYKNRGIARFELGDKQGGTNDIKISTELFLQEQKAFQDRMSKIKEDHEGRQRFIEELRRQAEKDKNSFN
ncbi:MAG: trypsin-like peptidase domain-containing protein [Rivularia sp. (in: Bacteria)]|nr:trypsin-like peptidase domain-containing protein [Rivularia sp. MS3]